MILQTFAIIICFLLPLGLLCIPLIQWIDYRIMVKKYGEEYANEFIKRWNVS